MNDFIVERNAKQSKIIPAHDLTAVNVPILKELLKKELTDGATEIVFDLVNTKILDSTGIGILVASYNSLNKVGGTISIINSSNDIKQLLQSMRLSDRLHVH